MSALVPGVLLAFTVVFFVLYPVLSGREARMEWDEEELTEAQHRRNIALLALRDVEYDFHAGKLDSTDYRRLKQQISAEALEAIDDEEAEWLAREAAGETPAPREGTPAPEARSALEAEIAALRDSIREGVICPQCGHPNPKGSRYCGDCGSGLAAPGGSSSRTVRGLARSR
jgi:hypothetical protein